MATVIVFGPTGGVGSATAVSAHQHGAAKVVLAMRDPSKSITSISSDAAGYERVQADLTDPASIKAAVTKTGAKYAYLYALQGNRDGMKSAITALKEAGITWIVFLSSATVEGDPHQSPKSDYITYLHAAVEINLEQIMGEEGYVALRPGWFATNVARWKPSITSGEIKFARPDHEIDWVVPNDIGRVGGALLAKGPQRIDPSQGKGRNHVVLVGPQILTHQQSVDLIAKVINKPVKLTQITVDEARHAMINQDGLPPFIADSLIHLEVNQKPNNQDTPEYKAAVGNIEKYGGRKSQTAEEFLNGEGKALIL